MKVTKVKGYLVTDQKPKDGDRLICVNRKNVAYGLITEPFKNGYASCLGTKEKVIPSLVDLGN